MATNQHQLPDQKQPLEQYRWLEDKLRSLIGPVKFSSEINLRLERMTHLLELLGNPHHAFRGIHVGGTSGKGSTSKMIATILEEAGYSVGLHTSPHLQIMNERHQINGKLVPTSVMCRAYAEMLPAIEQVGNSSKFGAPSYFEAQVALSFYLFREAKVDFGVIEVGLGGERDATNVLPAEVAVLTNVGLDHTEILGNTVVEIAKDKVGIFKPGQTVVTGVHQPEVFRIVLRRCAEVGAELWMMGRDFDIVADGKYIIVCQEEEFDDVHFGMSGRFQAKNGAVAVAAVRALHNVKISQEAIFSGLKKASLPGRVEVIQEQPTVVLDGAHNADKIQAALSRLDEFRRDGQTVTILALKAGKAAPDILPTIVKESDRIILTKFIQKGLWESTPPETLRNVIQEIDPEQPVLIEEDPYKALGIALQTASPEDVLWITGSLYLVGDLRAHWLPIEPLLNALEPLD